MGLEEDIIIRPFQMEEWPRLKAMRLRALKEHPTFFSASYEERAQMPDKYWQDAINSENGQIFGLFKNDHLIGITGVFDNGSDSKTAHFVMSYILPEHRGKGLSRFLYEARIDWARKDGFERIVIGHREGNEASYSANQKFGFQFIGMEKVTFPDGPALNYCYELKL